jgi:hypothetical protein
VSIVLSGERTFGVLTKLDLMDKGTNAIDVSAQQPMPSHCRAMKAVFLEVHRAFAIRSVQKAMC